MELIKSNKYFTFEYSEYNRKYYVCDNLGFNVTNLKLSFEEGNTLFGAIDFCDVDCLTYDPDAIQKTIQEVRKQNRCERELGMRLMELFLG